jgi:hypothetical protein
MSEQNGGFMGILANSRLLRQGLSRGCRECELLFFSTKLKKNIYRELKWKKMVLQRRKKSFPVFSFTKSNCSEQNINRNRHLKISFERC